MNLRLNAHFGTTRIGVMCALIGLFLSLIAPSSASPTAEAISVAAIGGVTTPIPGETPVTTVSAANGYSGTVTWSGAPATFAAETFYTATITLTPDVGYTLIGVAQNFFTVEGATSVTHNADSGVITAQFPAVFTCGDGTYTVNSAGTLISARGCSGDLVIDSSVTGIGDYAFYFLPTSLQTLTIPDSVLSIGLWAFFGGTAPHTINIGTGLSSIGGNALGSTSTRNINVSENNPNFSSISGVLFNKAKTTLLTYPAGKLETSYTIPSSVTEIAYAAFNGGLHLESVIFPDSVTTLGGGAFQQNNSLRSVTLGSGISVISGQAFYNNFGAGITEINFSSSTNLRRIEGSAFIGARWTSVVIPEGVETIDAGAFGENGYLIDLRLPLTINTLDDAALSNTYSLEKVCYLGSDANVIQAIVNNGKTVGCVSPPEAPTIDMTTTGNGLIRVSLTPGSNNGSAITDYQYSLDGTTYTSLHTSNTSSPLVIGGLTNGTSYTVRIKAVNALGAGAASAPVSATPALSYSSGEGDIACGTSGYFSLESNEVVSSTDCVGSVAIPSGTTSIGHYSFQNSAVASVTIPNTVTTLGMAVFRGATQLTSVIFESGSRLTSIGSATFERTAIEAITLPSTLTFLGNYAFWSNSALTSIVIPNGITEIYQNSFAQIPTLTSVTLPNQLTFIEFEAFKGSTALSTLVIPDSVENIGVDAFGNTTTLSRYTYCGPAPLGELTAAGLGGKTKASCSPPIAFLKSTFSPQIHLSGKQLICTAGTYQFGYTIDGVVVTETTGYVSPSKYTYNLFINGAVQNSLTITSASRSATWAITVGNPGSLFTCSVTVTVNSLSTVDYSTENTDGYAAAQSVLKVSKAAATEQYKLALKANNATFMSTFHKNRALWQKKIDATRANYYTILDRLKASPGSGKMIADAATALQVMNAAKAAAQAEYATSRPLANEARDASNAAALSTRDAAIAKANAIYGTFIESIGYGVLIP